MHRTTLNRMTFICLMCSFILGSYLYYIKHQVIETNRMYAHVNQKIFAVSEHIHTLKAEWSHLNQPQRLRNLSVAHLNLKPIGVIQVASLDTFSHKLTKDRETPRNPGIIRVAKSR